MLDAIKNVTVGFARWFFCLNERVPVGNFGLDDLIRKYPHYVGSVETMLLLMGFLFVLYKYTDWVYNTGRKEEREGEALPRIRKLRKENKDLRRENEELKEQLELLLSVNEKAE